MSEPERRPKVGEFLETAMWLSGTETEEQLQHFCTVVARTWVDTAAERHHLLVGPLQFTLKRPGENRVPPVPKGVSGPDVRMLVIEAEVLRWLEPGRQGAGFLAELEPDDLQTLRRATRRAHRRAHPGMPPLPDEHCDAFIEALGPEAAVAQLRAAAGAASH